MRKVRLSLVSAVASVFVLAAFAFAAGNVAFHAHAKLSGKNEVPEVKTKASGYADFKLSKDHKEMTYKLGVKNLEKPTAAHIHNGKKGANGPPVVEIPLFKHVKKRARFSGVLAEGKITDKDLMGDLQGKNLDALVDLIKSDSAYVNVHTETHPDGEIRGELK